MQNTLVQLFRSGSMHASALLPASQTMLATRAKIGYDNIKIRGRRYKSSAKEKRKQRKRQSMGFGAEQDDGEVPAFFLPSRYKLLAKVINDHKNTNRITRKPLPEDIKL